MIVPHKTYAKVRSSYECVPWDEIEGTKAGFPPPLAALTPSLDSPHGAIPSNRPGEERPR
jgi:hypothetical protein